MPSPRAARGPDLEALVALDLEAHLADPTIKQRYVTAMFDVIAPRYDRFTRWFSFGRDAVWKRDLIAHVADSATAPRVALDLASGTGDLARGVAAAEPPVFVMGLDISRPMLRLAAARTHPAPGAAITAASGERAPAARRRRIGWCVGDQCRLPVPDASIDLVTAGYAIRNAASWTATLDEVARVLRPGGRLLSLDFFLPRHRGWRRLFLGYLAVAGRAYGRAWHGAGAVYGYIAPSIAHFTTAEAFAQALEDRGLRVEHLRRRLGGGIAAHVARRVASR